MKAEIVGDGWLEITPQSETESYALKVWVEENRSPESLEVNRARLRICPINRK